MNKRLDVFLQEKYHVSRTKAAQAIAASLVTVNGVIQTKSSFLVKDTDEVSAEFKNKFVSFAGYKLEAILNASELDVVGFICLDAGLSTGGFADCLLQRGAARVYGVDVGTHQIDSQLARDPRLVIMEQTDIRSPKLLPEKVDLITLDLSFISVRLILESAVSYLKDNAHLIILVKPQFELGIEHVGKHGIVHDVDQQQRAVDLVIEKIQGLGLRHLSTVLAPHKQERANTEFLVYAIRD